MQTFFIICSSCCKQFFCLRLSANTFFTCIQFISVFTASANNLFQNFLTPPVKKIIVRSSRKTCYFKSAILLYSVRPKQHEFCSIHSIPQRPNRLCTSPIIPLKMKDLYNLCFSFLMGITVFLKRNRRQCLIISFTPITCKFGLKE